MEFQIISKLFMQGNISAVIEYMSRFDELESTVAAYRDLYEKENYHVYDVPKCLNDVLLEYQRYFRDVFYLKISDEEASDKLLNRLKTLLKETDDEDNTDTLQFHLSATITTLFEKNGYHILTGRTQGHYGPYVWKFTVPTTYEVELPDSNATYTVNILRGFIMGGWMRYLTFNQYGANGWTSPDGTINCIESAYDFESEAFRVSFLKHEAQHAEDFKSWPAITPMELEYRAKLVELIYTTTPGLLSKFQAEASDSNPENSHATASFRIVDEMQTADNQDVAGIQKRAKELFKASTNQLNLKYNLPLDSKEMLNVRFSKQYQN